MVKYINYLNSLEHKFTFMTQKIGKINIFIPKHHYNMIIFDFSHWFPENLHKSYRKIVKLLNVNLKAADIQLLLILCNNNHIPSKMHGYLGWFYLAWKNP